MPTGQKSAAALLGAPELVGATNSSLDFRVVLNQAATLYYVLVPQAGSSRRSLQQSTATWQQYTAAELRAAAAGWGTTPPEVRHLVCTSLDWTGRHVTIHVCFVQMSHCICIPNTQLCSCGCRRRLCCSCVNDACCRICLRSSNSCACCMCRQASTAACGSVYVGAANSNVTFSVETISNRECTQQHAALAAGAKTVSCSRCPLLKPSVTYDVLLVLGDSNSTGDIAHVQVGEAFCCHILAGTWPELYVTPAVNACTRLEAPTSCSNAPHFLVYGEFI